MDGFSNVTTAADYPTVSPVTASIDDSDGDASHDFISSLSDAQDKALSLIPLFTGLLSMWGSINIISMILGGRRAKYQDDSSSSLNCYKRIMLGLSCSDLLSSMVMALQPYLLPQETSQRIWASGTDATCSAIGFFQQLSLSNTWYNGMLSFMFLLTIRYSVSEERLAKRYEPWMHLLAIGFPLITACIAAILGIYGEVDVGHQCWMSTPGGAYVLAGFVTTALPNFFFVFAIPINNWRVYRHVRRQTIHKRKNLKESSAVMNHLSKASRSISNETAATVVEQLSETASGGTHHLSTIQESLAAQTEETQQRQQQQEREEQRQQAREQSLQDRQNEQVKEVAFQAFLYVASFLVTILPTMILRAMTGPDIIVPATEDQYFPLLVIQAVLWPLQGFFNYFIYARSCPSYVRET